MDLVTAYANDCDLEYQRTASLERNRKEARKPLVCVLCEEGHGQHTDTNPATYKCPDLKIKEQRLREGRPSPQSHIALRSREGVSPMSSMHPQ